MNPTEWKIVPTVASDEMVKAAVLDNTKPKATNTLDRMNEAVSILYASAVNAAPPSPFVMVAREDLRLVLNPPATQDWKSTQMVADAEARLTQALETQPQAEG